MHPWSKIKFPVLAGLIDHDGWQWQTVVVAKKKRLRVVNPRGVVFDFRLHRGAFLRRVEQQ